MKEIQAVVNDKVATMVTDGTLEKLIADNVQKSIASAIEEQFRSYGSITKQISSVIENGLKLNPSDIDFQSYNEQMLVAVKTKLGNLFAGAASEKFMSEIDSLLKPAPSSISLKELVEFIVTDWRESEDADYLDDEAAVEIEHHSYGISLKLWKKSESSFGITRSTDAEIFLSNLRSDKDYKIRINHSQHYNPTCFDAAEAFIFKLYAAGSTITGVEDFDACDCDLTLKTDDY